MKNIGINAGRTQIIDIHGRSTTFFGADSYGGVINGSGLSIDLEPSQFDLEDRTPDYFFIIPEIDPAAAVGTLGTITVQLDQQVDVESFVITANQLLAFAGQPLPYRIKKVFKTGTNEDFSIIW